MTAVATVVLDQPDNDVTSGDVDNARAMLEQKFQKESIETRE